VPDPADCGTENQVFDPLVPVRSHDHQVRLDPVREADNLLPRIRRVADRNFYLDTLLAKPLDDKSP